MLKIGRALARKGVGIRNCIGLNLCTGSCRGAAGTEGSVPELENYVKKLEIKIK